MNLLVLCVFLTVVTSVSVRKVYPQEYESEWVFFKVGHQKYYKTETEEHFRRCVFMANLNFIRQHNRKYERGEVTFTVGVNQFADMTSEEIRKTINGFKMPTGNVRKCGLFELDVNFTAPPSVDWRNEGAVTPVKDQRRCGSCWAFSTTGSLEGQTFLKTKTLTSLSEQNLMDCSGAYGNHGCDGGLMDRAFAYIRDNRGINTEASYPYTARDGPCRFQPKNIGATCTGYVDITSGSESALQQAVATKGPIAVAIDASQWSFHFYKQGVYSEAKCTTTNLDHAVLAVGYGTSGGGGGDYWLVKNSWGTSWGMNGYIMMAKNKNNMCGIATKASYPTV